MSHHAYFIAAEADEGMQAAYEFLEAERGLHVLHNPDVMTLQYGLLSVDDARALCALADLSPTTGSEKALVISASRLFHEAQNALLKLFEEPPEGTTLILVIPAEGMLLPTLRSRLLTLPKSGGSGHAAGIPALPAEAQEFLAARVPERAKLIEKLLNRTKSDKDDEKQAARLAAIRLIEGLTQKAHEDCLAETNANKKRELQRLLDDLAAFTPILHQRSAPLKLIFEHVLITLPPLAK
ncbi:MAG: hypothetical protein P4M11_09670 [Candidatus Pacebacteria bacterium]|nr:hypothetical protein [Candidatus Paceibacterota bacterium]